MRQKLLSKVLMLTMVLSILLGCCVFTASAETKQSVQVDTSATQSIKKGGRYDTPEDVAAYLNKFGCLPSNYITKKDAKKAGWAPRKGNLWEVTDHMSIGGDIFTNAQKSLPTKSGRVYHECDVNYHGGHRGTDRLVFSTDGLIFFTNDHYRTFEQLY